MRVIKFKAWNKKAGRWIYPDVSGLLILTFEMLYPLTGVFYIHDETDSGHDNYELMQYTGLKDGWGQEIFEGDIVRYEGNDVGAVTYVAACFCCDLNDGGRRPLHDCFEESLEVIGNIMENPELL